MREAGSRFAAGRGFLAAALLLVSLALAGCTSHAERIAGFRESWGSGNYVAAEQCIDQLIAEDTSVAVEVVAKTHALDPSIVSSKGNTYLLLLEKAMTRLALGDPATSVKVLLKARDELDKHYSTTFGDQFKGLADDESMAYAGADYEHIMVRVLLAVVDLLIGEGDAYAYSLQVGEKQEEIINSDYGEAKNNYYPRRQYQRVAIGAYVQGMIQEANLDTSEAALAYKRGLSYSAGNPALVSSLQRTESGKYAPDGCGVLHVFYLAGRGPHLDQTTSEPMNSAVQLAAVGMALAGSAAQLGQAPIPVPTVVVNDPNVPPLSVDTDGNPPVQTVTILDVNMVATQQLAANMPGIEARALVRRAVKGVAGAAVEQSMGGVEGMLAGMFTTMALTAGERAETRNWVSLPAQIQVARVAMPEGDRRVSFGPGMEGKVKITRGRDSYAVVLRPNLNFPGSVVVDRFSFVEPPKPETIPPIPPPGATPAGPQGAAPTKAPPAAAPASPPTKAPPPAASPVKASPPPAPAPIVKPK
jgi:hypothetical protein